MKIRLRYKSGIFKSLVYYGELGPGGKEVLENSKSDFFHPPVGIDVLDFDVKTVCRC